MNWRNIIMDELGRLEKVDIRKIWEHEAHSFTPWLAEPENLAILGEVLGIEFNEDDVRKEVLIGNFNNDSTIFWINLNSAT